MHSAGENATSRIQLYVCVRQSDLMIHDCSGKVLKSLILLFSDPLYSFITINGIIPKPRIYENEKKYFTLY